MVIGEDSYSCPAEGFGHLGAVVVVMVAVAVVVAAFDDPFLRTTLLPS